MAFVDNGPRDNRCPFCATKRRRIDDHWAPICHRCGRDIKEDLQRRWQELAMLPPEEFTELMLQNNAGGIRRPSEGKIETDTHRSSGAGAHDQQDAESPPKKSGGCLVGCLSILGILIVISMGLRACGIGVDSNGDGTGTTCVERIMKDRNISEADASTFCDVVHGVQNDMGDNVIGNASAG